MVKPQAIDVERYGFLDVPFDVDASRAGSHASWKVRDVGGKIPWRCALAWFEDDGVTGHFLFRPFLATAQPAER